MENEIINRVAESGIVTIDLEDFYPEDEIIAFDLKPFLFMDMVLKEKDFRAQLKEHDWSFYQNKKVAVFCSSEAIIPRWAYMLVMTYLLPATHYCFISTPAAYAENLTLQALQQKTDLQTLTDKRIVIKGCGDKNLSERVYSEITKMLLPIAKSIMYGEACSSVPVYKRK